MTSVISYGKNGHQIWSTHPIEKPYLVYKISSVNPQLAVQAALTVINNVSAIDLNGSGKLKFHDLTQYATSRGDLMLIRKFSSREIQCILNRGKWMIFDEVKVPHFSRPWEHSLVCDCEAYIWCWAPYRNKKNIIKILKHYTESQELQLIIEWHQDLD